MLTAERILFKKLHNMPSPKIGRRICNVPIDTFDISNTLPRHADSNGFVIVKLNCKREYRGYGISKNPYVINQLL